MVRGSAICACLALVGATLLVAVCLVDGQEAGGRPGVGCAAGDRVEAEGDRAVREGDGKLSGSLDGADLWSVEMARLSYLDALRSFELAVAGQRRTLEDRLQGDRLARKIRYVRQQIDRCLAAFDRQRSS